MRARNCKRPADVGKPADAADFGSHPDAIIASTMPNRPDGGPPREEAAGRQWLNPLRSWINRRLNAPAAADPLYLSNRTLGQRIKLWALVGVPCLALAMLVWFGLTGRRSSGPEPGASAAATGPLSSIRDLEILDARVVHGATTSVEGSIRNNTAHPIPSAEVVFDLTDANGSQVGGVKARVDHLEPRARIRFKVQIPQSKAVFALVRELHTM